MSPQGRRGTTRTTTTRRNTSTMASPVTQSAVQSTSMTTAMTSREMVTSTPGLPRAPAWTHSPARGWAMSCQTLSTLLAAAAALRGCLMTSSAKAPPRAPATCTTQRLASVGRRRPQPRLSHQSPGRRHPGTIHHLESRKNSNPSSPHLRPKSQRQEALTGSWGFFFDT